MTQATDVGGVTVGIHEGIGVHPGTNRQPGTGETVAEIGAKNHFGDRASKIPARPWLDVGLQKAQPEINRIVKKYGPIEPLEMVLHRMGQAGQDSVQQYIEDLRTPPNSKMTRDLKGSSNPLIDSGVMQKSVTYELTDELPEEGLDI